MVMLVVLQVIGFAADTGEEVTARASALVRSGKVEQAEALLREASSSDPSSATLHGELGEVLLRENKYELSVQELGIAVQIVPDSPKYIMALSEALIGWQHFGVAVDFLRAAESRIGKYPGYHYNLGLAYYNLDKIKEAQSEFQDALRLDPQLDRAQFLLAGCLANEGDTVKAIEMYRKLIKQRPNDPIYWIALGQALGQMGGTYGPEAVRACRRGLALRPGDPHAQFVTATVLGQSGDFAAARPMLEHLERLDPNVIYVHFELARVYTRLGERELARKETTIANDLQQKASEGSSIPPANQGISSAH